MREKSPVRFVLKCPYTACGRDFSGLKSGSIVRRGRYFRKEDSKWISRFRCLNCDRSFSSSRLTPSFGQKKRRLNPKIHVLLCSGVSQRRIARLLRINRKTVVRKFLFLARLAKLDRERFLALIPKESISLLQFDEMESFEKSKCLPVSIPLLVLPESRKIISFRVGRMPANGPLAAISRRKYGPRKDDRAEIARSLFSEIKTLVARDAEITTDRNPKYPGWIRPHFSTIKHRAIKGRRGCIVGQGELKKIGFDPLFSLNHTCAMLRANINRLFRRTWCTTKRRDRLEAHIEIYVQYHNQVLT